MTTDQLADFLITRTRTELHAFLAQLIARGQSNEAERDLITPLLHAVGVQFARLNLREEN